MTLDAVGLSGDLRQCRHVDVGQSTCARRKTQSVGPLRPLDPLERGLAQKTRRRRAFSDYCVQAEDSVRSESPSDSDTASTASGSTSSDPDFSSKRWSTSLRSGASSGLERLCNVASTLNSQPTQPRRPIHKTGCTEEESMRVLAIVAGVHPPYIGVRDGSCPRRQSPKPGPKLIALSEAGKQAIFRLPQIAGGA